VKENLLHYLTLLDTRCMNAVATYAVAVVTGAFDTTIATQRRPSIANKRVILRSAIERKSSYEP
jgi:hypothetical protein